MSETTVNRDTEFREWVEREGNRAKVDDALEAVDRCIAQAEDALRLTAAIRDATSEDREKARRDLCARVTGHLPGMRTRRRWWQRRVPVVVPETLVRGAVRSARINGALRFNAELATCRDETFARLGEFRRTGYRVAYAAPAVATKADPTCPRCGYPEGEGGPYKGIYSAGRPCDRCGYEVPPA